MQPKLFCWGLGSPEGRAGGQAHSTPRTGLRAGASGQGRRESPSKACSDLATHLGLHLPGPSEEPSWGASGSSCPGRRGEHRGVALAPMGLLHRAPTLCVSMCGACEHLTGSHAWSPGQEARDPGPGSDTRTSPKSLPTCCRALSPLLSRPPSEEFSSVPLTPSHPVFP